mmetsp:Transcript_48178/g.104349  ORF Transcript_48178/g.104349 Transcript_48178/m.104349 type:complete len:364 (-) Transcript_48178:326-1417(-)
MGGCASRDEDHGAEPPRQPHAQAPTRPQPAGLPRTFAGPHADMATCVAAAATGQAFSAGDDGSVALVSWAEGVVLERWRGHKKSVNGLACASNLNGVFTASRDCTIRLWKRAAPEHAQELAGHSLTVSAIAFDGANTLFSGSRDSTVRLWDVSTGRCVSQRAVSRNVVTCAATVPHESLVWQGSEDLRLRLWDTRTLQPAATLQGYVYFPLSMAADGNFCLTGSNGFDSSGCELRIWDRRMLRELLSVPGHEHAVTGVAILNDPNRKTANTSSGVLRVASASKDGSVKCWQVNGSTAEVLDKLSLSIGCTSLTAAHSEETDVEFYVSCLDGSLHALGRPKHHLRPAATTADGLQVLACAAAMG